MHDDWLPAGWLQPGRMVVEEQLDDSMAVHVRLDCGVTWQRIRQETRTPSPDLSLKGAA